MKRGCWNWWNYKTMFEVVHLKYISTATPYFWCTHKNESPIHTPLNLEVNAVERSTSHHVGRYASDVSPVICHSGSRWIKKYTFRHPHTHTHTAQAKRGHTRRRMNHPGSHPSIENELENISRTRIGTGEQLSQLQYPGKASCSPWAQKKGMCVSRWNVQAKIKKRV